MKNHENFEKSRFFRFLIQSFWHIFRHHRALQNHFYGGLKPFKALENENLGPGAIFWGQVGLHPSHKNDQKS